MLVSNSSKILTKSMGGIGNNEEIDFHVDEEVGRGVILEILIRGILSLEEMAFGIPIFLRSNNLLITYHML